MNPQWRNGRAPAHSPDSTRTGVILLAVVIIMVDGFDLQAIGFVAPEIARSWAIELAAFGPVFSAALAGSMLGAMAAGTLTRLVGLRATLAMSLLIFGSGTLTTAFAQDLLTLMTLRFIVGLGLGAAVPVVMSIVAENSSPRFRATLIVLALCGQPVGAILGAALCARLIPAYGWQSAFFLGGVLPLLLILPVLLLLKNSAVPKHADMRHVRPTEASARVRRLFAADLRATTTLLWAASFLGVFFIYIIVNWLPGLVRSDGHSLQMSVRAISFFNFGGILGALTWSALMDRYGPFKVLPAAFGLAAFSMAMLDPLRGAPSAFTAATFLSGFAGYGGVMALGPLTVMLYPRSAQTLGTGWVIGTGRLGAALGPLGAGFALAAGLAMSQLFYFAAGAALLVMTSLILLATLASTSLHPRQ